MRFLLLSVISLTAILPNHRAAAAPFLKGMTISCQTSGWEWGTPQMKAAIDELKSLGVNAIAIHPYAQIHVDGSLTFPTGLVRDSITRPLDWAHERGMSVMLIPHIAYWGTPWLWRGEINFKTEAEWNRFFTDYQRWIVRMATIAEAHHAGTLCIGLEYVHAQKFAQRWRKIIAAVRKVYHGKLTYGANWDHIDDVPFWDALDEIGVLAYFPLTKIPNPSAEQIVDGWKPWLQKLGAMSKKYGKPILFTEIGYNDSAKCAAQPWDFHELGGKDAKEIQARCVAQALQLQRRAPFLAGEFFWKWFPDMPVSHHHEHETFDLRSPLLKNIIARYWRTPQNSQKAAEQRKVSENP